MDKTMKAVYYDKPGRENASFAELPYPVCGDNQVIIKVMAAGICKNSDSTIDVRPTPLDVFPVVPGHEFAGIVKETGLLVTDIKKGDRVTADNTVLCGDCYYCRKNDPLHCDKFGSLGHNVYGGFAEFVVVDKSKVFRIPDTMSFNAAALTEPVACCLHAIDRMNVNFGDDVVVYGAGPNGLILSMLARASNAIHVVCVAPTQKKLDILSAKGIDTILMDKNNHSIHEKELNRRFPHGVDIVVESTGSQEMIGSAINILKKGGKLVQYGTPSGNRFTHLDVQKMYFNEISYITACCQTHNFGRALKAIEEGIVDCDALVSHEFALDEYFKALDLNKTDHEAIKVMIHP